MYIDDLVTGSNSLEEFKDIKQNSVQLFKIGVSIYIRRTQMPELESESSNQSELTYVKQALNKGRILNKQHDAVSVVAPTFKNDHYLTK